MPEGDTVWNTAHLVLEALHGQVLIRSDFRVPQLATVDLAGAAVRESACRGKHLLLRLTAPGTGRPVTLHSHLRMEGSWRTFAAGARWTGGPGHQIRVALYTEKTVAVGYHLHELRLVPTGDEQRLVGHLGPDLLGPDWDAAEAVRRLAGHPDETIAEALLDQTSLAGIGNMYKCEILFLRRISPWAKVSTVEDLGAVVALAHQLLQANRGRWTQSTTGSLHRGQTSFVYGRRAQPCRRCGTLIRKTELGDRVTYWCPHCQPGE
jgi:endonuclease VIII